MRIYVGNLSYQTTEENLQTAFAAFGTVGSVSIVRDRHTSESRGFGFIEMDDDKEASEAITGLSGTRLDGRTLTVNQARPRSTDGARSGRTGGPRDDSREREQRW